MEKGSVVDSVEAGDSVVVDGSVEADDSVEAGSVVLDSRIADVVVVVGIATVVALLSCRLRKESFTLASCLARFSSREAKLASSRWTAAMAWYPSSKTPS